MSSGKSPASVTRDTSFDEIVNDTCERLKDKRVQYSIQRINEMEELLNALEQELDQFIIFKKTGK